MNNKTESEQLILANRELVFQNKEKDKRAAELVIANNELVFQHEEKAKRANELMLANKELVYQNEEKAKRAAELVIANEKLVFESKEKAKRADELVIANKELVFQNEEKEKRADELIIANKELAFQHKEKEKRADELVIANNELIFQNEQKEKRATELIAINGELEKSQEKVMKGKRLYSFISHINQTIVHAKDVHTLFSEACRIAIELENFKMVWIGMFDHEAKKITLVQQSGMNANDISLFSDVHYQVNGLQDAVLHTGTYYICNDIANDFKMEGRKEFMASRGLHSCMVLPIKTSDEIVGTFNLYTEEINFFDKEEIALLVEVAGDISFALDMFENARIHKDTEELVIHNEKRFRALIEHSTDMKTLTDENGIIQYGSPSIAKVLGYSEEDFLHKPAQAFMHPDDIPGYIENRSKILEAPGKSFYSQMRLLHKNGDVVWCEGMVTNLLEEPGIQAIVSNFGDISEKKKTERQNEFDGNNLNALINNTSDLMWSVDKDFKLITANEPFDDIMKLMSGKRVEKGEDILAASFSPEQMIRYKALYERAFAGEAFTEVEYMNAPIESWSEITFNPIRKGDEVVGTACHSRDVTERKRGEVKLEGQNKELLKTNSELDRFVYSTSHDLRAPLSSLLGLIGLLVEDTAPENALQKERLNMLELSVVKLDNFIEDILDYSRNARTEKGADVILFEDLIKETRGKHKFMEGTSGFNLQVKIDQKGKFISDKRRIGVVLNNLISNAVKYQDAAKEKPYVKVFIQSNEKQATIVVEDNGIGIEEKNKEKIFEMFYRGSIQSSGSGLGLYIVKETVEKLGATISLESELLKGSKFTVIIPNSLNHES